MQFHIARTFELFVNHVVHAAAGFNKRCRNNGKRTALFHITRCAEKAFRTVQSVGINTAGQNFARSRHDGIIGACQTGNRIQQDYHVFFMFNHTFGFFNHHLGHLYMALRRFVKRRGNHFAAYRTAHFGHFFRTLVNQQDNQLDIGIIGGNGVGNVLQHHGFTGFRRRNQQCTLAFTDWGNQVDGAAGQILFGFDVALKFELFGWE